MGQALESGFLDFAQYRVFERGGDYLFFLLFFADDFLSED